jgi:hypothetical protein
MEYKMSNNKVEYDHVQSMLKSLTFEFARIGKSTTTVCNAYLPNGFRVGLGDSICLNPDDFRSIDGIDYAKKETIKNSENLIWQLEGYLLKVTGKTSDEFTFPLNPVKSAYERLLEERSELKERFDKLVIFLQGDRPKFISSDDWALLDDQQLVMRKLLDILNLRIKSFKE